MQEQFWKERWVEGLIGFHKSETHELLEKHISSLKKGNVLVPLCGKTLDMIYLRDRGFEVTGVELSELAVDQFEQENGLSFERSSKDGLQYLKSPNLTLIQGNLFQYRPQSNQLFGSVYDRASAIALPKDLRAKYYQHVRSLLKPGGTILMIILATNDDQLMPPLDFGPPFFIPMDEIKNAFRDDEIELLEGKGRPTTNIPDRYKEMGLEEIRECVLKITIK